MDYALGSYVCLLFGKGKPLVYNILCKYMTGEGKRALIMPISAKAIC